METRRSRLGPALLALLALTAVEAFYLPGLAPVTYCEKDAELPGKCMVRTNALFSVYER